MIDYLQGYAQLTNDLLPKLHGKTIVLWLSMDVKERASLLASLTILVTLDLSLPAFVHSHCNRNPVIFNFGDSNSDTGGYAAAHGLIFGPPEGRTFFHHSAGRWCDGRLVMDFLSESLNTHYLSPYLDSLGPNYTNGANFAISGSSILPRSVPFSLHVQINQFNRFQNRSLQLISKGVKNLVGDDDFKNALYTIDIGQNDLSASLGHLSYAQVTENIPSFISEIKEAIKSLYQRGGKNFWVHSTGPLGCLPEKLATSSKNTSEFDQYGCLQLLNEGAKVFNEKLRALCEELRLEMKNAIIVYVDVYAIKYDLIAKAAIYGFENPLMACCGHGGPPYNYNPNIKCGQPGYQLVCEEKGSRYISWDGVHYTEAANAFVASKILSSNYSTPPTKFEYFCNA